MVYTNVPYQTTVQSVWTEFHANSQESFFSCSVITRRDETRGIKSLRRAQLQVHSEHEGATFLTYEPRT